MKASNVFIFLLFVCSQVFGDSTTPRSFALDQNTFNTTLLLMKMGSSDIAADGSLRLSMTDAFDKGTHHLKKTQSRKKGNSKKSKDCQNLIVVPFPVHLILFATFELCWFHSKINSKNSKFSSLLQLFSIYCYSTHTYSPFHKMKLEIFPKNQVWFG